MPNKNAITAVDDFDALLEACLHVLRSHFGPRAVAAGKPASSRDIAAVAPVMKGIAPGLSRLLTRFDGLSVEGIEYEVERTWVGCHGSCRLVHAAACDQWMQTTLQ